MSRSGSHAGMRGSMMLECVICMPLLLTLIFGSLQLAHIWLARQVVEYAAWSAARSLLTEYNDDDLYRQTARKAAARICAWIALSQSSGASGVDVAGWGEVPGSGDIDSKLQIKIDNSDPWNPVATVIFDFPLVMPIAGPIIGWAVNPWSPSSAWLEQKADITGNAHGGEDVRYPYIRFTETASVIKPYVTLK